MLPIFMTIRHEETHEVIVTMFWTTVHIVWCLSVKDLLVWRRRCYKPISRFLTLNRRKEQVYNVDGKAILLPKIIFKKKKVIENTGKIPSGRQYKNPHQERNIYYNSKMRYNKRSHHAHMQSEDKPDRTNIMSIIYWNSTTKLRKSSIIIMSIIFTFSLWFSLDWFMVLNTIFNNISVISWRSVLLMEETGVPGGNHRPVTSHWQSLSLNVVSSTPRHERGSNSQR